MQSERHISPELCWELKKKGLPQPTPKAGQRWYNLFDYPFMLLSLDGGDLWAKNLWTGAIRPFDGVVSEGMVYAPSFEEEQSFLESLKQKK